MEELHGDLTPTNSWAKPQEGRRVVVCYPTPSEDGGAKEPCGQLDVPGRRVESGSGRFSRPIHQPSHYFCLLLELQT